MSKDKDAVEAIKKDLISILNGRYGYCGVMEGNNEIMLNSGEENIIITIKWD